MDTSGEGRRNPPLSQHVRLDRPSRRGARRPVPSPRSEAAKLRLQILTLGHLAKSRTYASYGLAAALREITETAAMALDVARASIWFLDDGDEFVRCADLFVAAGHRHDFGEAIDATQRREYLRTLERENVLAIDDVSRDRRVDDIRAKVLEPRGIGALLDAPIRLEGEMRGSLVLSHIGGARGWSVTDQTFAAALADYVSRLVEMDRRHRAEEALQRSYLALQRAHRAAKIGFWDWTKGASREFAHLAHNLFSREGSARPRTVAEQLEAINPEDRQRVAAVFARADAEALDYDVEYRVPSPDGAVRHVREIGEAAFDDGGRYIGHIGTVQDITDLKRIEESLRDSEERMRVIAETAPVPIFITRLDDGMILYANPQAGAMVGLSPAELLGRRSKEFMHEPRDRGRLIEALRREGVVDGMEIRHRRLDGSTFLALVSLRPVTFAGEAAAVAAVTDVTERKELEEMLRQAQKMEAVGLLTGGVAHDFNNLLAIVLGNLELLDERLGGDEELHDLLRRAIGAGERGAELVRRLLAFSRQRPLSPVVVDLNDLVRGVHDLLQRSLGETITIALVLAPEPWPTRVDLGDCESMLLNLALNARDAMPRGGRLVIETVNLQVESHTAPYHERVPPGDYVLLKVSDNGTGMAPGTMERVFEPFFTTKDDGRGTGLGLSMVYGFVSQSKGHIRLSSELGIGTRVSIYLPRVETGATSSGVEQGLAAPSEGMGQTVLVVEDDAAVRQVAVAFLSGFGYRTLEAADGSTALEMLAAGHGIDLLFTDVVLPGGISGPEVAARARQIRPGLKVLFMSGYTEDAVSSRQRLGTDAELIMKPFTKAELARQVSRVVNGATAAGTASTTPEPAVDRGTR